MNYSVDIESNSPPPRKRKRPSSTINKEPNLAVLFHGLIPNKSLRTVQEQASTSDSGIIAGSSKDLTNSISKSDNGASYADNVGQQSTSALPRPITAPRRPPSPLRFTLQQIQTHAPLPPPTSSPLPSLTASSVDIFEENAYRQSAGLNNMINEGKKSGAISRAASTKSAYWAARALSPIVRQKAADQDRSKSRIISHKKASTTSNLSVKKDRIMESPPSDSEAEASREEEEEEEEEYQEKGRQEASSPFSVDDFLKSTVLPPTSHMKGRGRKYISKSKSGKSKLAEEHKEKNRVDREKRIKKRKKILEMAEYTSSEEEGREQEEEGEAEEAEEITPPVKIRRSGKKTPLKAFLVDNSALASASKRSRPLALVPHFLGDEGGLPSAQVKHSKRVPKAKALQFGRASQLEAEEAILYKDGMTDIVHALAGGKEKEVIILKDPRKVGKKETFLGDIGVTAFANMGSIELHTQVGPPRGRLSKKLELEKKKENDLEEESRKKKSGHQPITSRGFTEQQVNLARPPLELKKRQKSNNPVPVPSKFPRLEMVAEVDWNERFVNLAERKESKVGKNLTKSRRPDTPMRLQARVQYQQQANLNLPSPRLTTHCPSINTESIESRSFTPLLEPDREAIVISNSSTAARPKRRISTEISSPLAAIVEEEYEDEFDIAQARLMEAGPVPKVTTRKASPQPVIPLDLFSLIPTPAQNKFRFITGPKAKRHPTLDFIRQSQAQLDSFHPTRLDSVSPPPDARQYRQSEMKGGRLNLVPRQVYDTMRAEEEVQKLDDEDYWQFVPSLQVENVTDSQLVGQDERGIIQELAAEGVEESMIVDFATPQTRRNILATAIAPQNSLPTPAPSSPNLYNLQIRSPLQRRVTFSSPPSAFHLHKPSPPRKELDEIELSIHCANSIEESNDNNERSSTKSPGSARKSSVRRAKTLGDSSKSLINGKVFDKNSKKGSRPIQSKPLRRMSTVPAFQIPSSDDPPREEEQETEEDNEDNFVHFSSHEYPHEEEEVEPAKIASPESLPLSFPPPNQQIDLSLIRVGSNQASIDYFADEGQESFERLLINKENELRREGGKEAIRKKSSIISHEREKGQGKDKEREKEKAVRKFSLPNIPAFFHPDSILSLPSSYVKEGAPIAPKRTRTFGGFKLTELGFGEGV